MIPKSIIGTFKNKLTFAYKPPISPNKSTLCFIPGFRSDFITSKKSNLIYDYAQEHELGFLSWNHTEEGSVVDWYRDGLELIQQYKSDDCYYIGASMGLWISLLLASSSSPKGILGIGGGIDFTERWLKNEVPVEQRNNADYIWKRPSQYDSKGYYEIPVSFLLNSRPALIMPKDNKRKVNCCPIHLIHGTLDHDVSIGIAKQQYKYFTMSNSKVYFYEIIDGDHQLSRSQDLDCIRHKIKLMIEKN